MDEQEREYKLDLDIEKMGLPILEAYADLVGVQATYARAIVGDAVRSAFQEVADNFGDEKPPEGYIPPAILNVPPKYLVGFIWLAARHDEGFGPSLFKRLWEQLDVDSLYAAFFGALNDKAEEAEAAPLPNRAARRAASRPSMTRSRSTSPSRAGAVTKSTTSPSASGTRSSKPSTNEPESD